MQSFCDETQCLLQLNPTALRLNANIFVFQRKIFAIKRNKYSILTLCLLIMNVFHECRTLELVMAIDKDGLFCSISHSD